MKPADVVGDKPHHTVIQLVAKGFSMPTMFHLNLYQVTKSITGRVEVMHSNIKVSSTNSWRLKGRRLMVATNVIGIAMGILLQTRLS